MPPLFPPSLFFKLHSPSPLSVLLHQFFLHPDFFFYCFTFDFHVRIQLQPVTFFPLICSLAPAHFDQFSIRLYFQQFDCWPHLVLILLVTHYFLLFPLPPHSLSPSSILLPLWWLWCKSLLHFFFPVLLLTLLWFFPHPLSCGTTDILTPAGS